MGLGDVEWFLDQKHPATLAVGDPPLTFRGKGAIAISAKTPSPRILLWNPTSKFSSPEMFHYTQALLWGKRVLPCGFKRVHDATKKKCTYSAPMLELGAPKTYGVWNLSI